MTTDKGLVRARFFFFFSSRRRHTRYWRDWSSDVCSSDLAVGEKLEERLTLVPLETSYRAQFADGSHLDVHADVDAFAAEVEDRKSTRLNSSHANISYAVFCLKKKNKTRMLSTYP